MTTPITHPDITLPIGTQIRQARTSVGMSISLLARRTRTSRSYITSVEAGRVQPTWTAVVRIWSAITAHQP